MKSPKVEGLQLLRHWFTVTRRTVLKSFTGIVVLAGATPLTRRRAEAQNLNIPLNEKQIRGTLVIAPVINGKQHRISIDPRTSLLDLLRETLHLNGAKKGCDHGQCGACTVHINGNRVASCLTMAAKVNNKNVLTIEGISDGQTLHPMQQAFIDNDALQCGYCTPGQIMAAIACVNEGHATSDDSIREYMSGNICRCGAYEGILLAVKQVEQQQAKG